MMVYIDNQTAYSVCEFLGMLIKQVLRIPVVEEYRFCETYRWLMVLGTGSSWLHHVLASLLFLLSC